MSVNIPGAPSAAQAKDDIARLGELKLRASARGKATENGLKRIAYIGLGALLVANLVVGVLIVSGAVNGQEQAQALEQAQQASISVASPEGRCS